MMGSDGSDWKRVWQELRNWLESQRSIRTLHQGVVNEILSVNDREIVLQSRHQNSKGPRSIAVSMLKRVWNDLVEEFPRSVEVSRGHGAIVRTMFVQCFSGEIEEPGRPYLRLLTPELSCMHAGKGKASKSANERKKADGAASTAATLTNGLAQSARQRRKSSSNQSIMDVEEFDPENIEDARDWIARSIVRRQGQGEFRRKLLTAYGNCCAVTGCDVIEVLDAAHIMPFLGPKTDHICNGLLLRTDIHTLFDQGLMWVDPQSFALHVSPQLNKSDYVNLRGRKLRLPKDKNCRPSRAALVRRQADCRRDISFMNSC